MSESQLDGLREETTEERTTRLKVQEWNIESQSRLLSFVQQNPCLYNRESSDFRDKTVKQDAWNLIGKNLNITGDDACKHFTFLREKYGRYLRVRRNGKVGKLFKEGFHVAPQMEFLKTHIIERRRRQPDEFEQILGSEQNYDDFSFNGVTESLVSGSQTNEADSTHGKRTLEEAFNDGSASDPDSDVQIVDSRSLRPSKEQKIGGSKSSQNNLTKFEDESRINENLRSILARDTTGQEGSPNYVFGIYVTSKLNKMSDQEASLCTFRIHEILLQAEMGKFNNSRMSLPFSNDIANNNVYK